MERDSKNSMISMGEEEVEQDALLRRKSGGDDDETDLPLLTQHHGRESLSNHNHHHHHHHQDNSTPFIQRLSDACYALFCFKAEYDGDDDEDCTRHEEAVHDLLLEDQVVGSTTHRNESDPLQAYLLSILVSIWVLCSLWFLTGLMGPGVRSMIMLEMPVALFFLSLPLWLPFQPKQASWWRSNCPHLCGPQHRYRNAVLGALIPSTWVLMESSTPLAPFITIMWLVMWGSLYSMYVLLEKLTREFQRRTQRAEDPPDTRFWQRLDSCLVHVLRGIGCLMVVSYLLGVVLLSIDTFSMDGALDFFMDLVILSSMFAAPFYFLFVTILVLERPRPAAAAVMGEFPSATADTQHRKVIRMARQFVLHPNDPLGEPLLLV